MVQFIEDKHSWRNASGSQGKIRAEPRKKQLQREQRRKMPSASSLSLSGKGVLPDQQEEEFPICSTLRVPRWLRQV